jgi:alanyl-tRNA synthetase
LDAGQIAKYVGEVLGGSGGGRPTLGQTGGNDISKLPEAREKGVKLIEEKLKKSKRKKE